MSQYRRDGHGFVILTRTLAKIARETMADIATPGDALGVVTEVGKRLITVDVGNPNAENYGENKYDVDQLSVPPDTFAYWQRQGYLD